MFDDEMDLLICLFCLAVLAFWCRCYPILLEAAGGSYTWLPR